MAVTRTENVIHCTSQGDTLDAKLVICAIAPGGTMTAGDVVSISEYSGTAGNIIYKVVPDADGFIAPLCGVGITVDGIRVDSLTSGYVTIYHE